jgi:DNA-binding Lrp family transcriptional regulator
LRSALRIRIAHDIELAAQPACLGLGTLVNVRADSTNQVVILHSSEMVDQRTLDALDLALLRALNEHRRAGVLELSRLTGVARATVTARLQRLEDAGVITGYGPDIDVTAAGFGVHAFVTLEIAQGAIDDVRRDLESIPGVLEAHATTGSGDVLCRVAARSHESLQQTLVELDRSHYVVRSTSVIALSQLVAWRTLPLLESKAAPGAGRSAMPTRPAR